MVSHIDHINIVVRDVERSLQFYCRLLGLTESFRVELQGEWVETVVGLADAHATCVFLEFPSGRTRIELLQYHTPAGKAFSENSRPNTVGVRHFAFEVDDLDAFLQRMREMGVEPDSEPVTVPFPVGDRGRKRLLYFRDPDGVLLEVAEYGGGQR